MGCSQSAFAYRSAHLRALAAAALTVALALGGTALAPSAAAATGPTTEVLKASLGSKGGNGTAMLSVFATGLGSVEVSLRALKPASPYVAAIQRVTCTQVGSVPVALPKVVTSKAGAATLHSALTAAQVAAIRSEVRATSRVVVGPGAGSLARCGALKLTSRSPRVGSTTLRLRAPDGSPLAGLPVTYTQTTHDFRVGVGMTARDSAIPFSSFEELARVGSSYSLPYVSWNMTEPDPDTGSPSRTRTGPTGLPTCEPSGTPSMGTA